MLTQLENPRVAYVSRVLALPIIAMVVFSFTVRTNQNSNSLFVNGTNNIYNSDTIPKKAKEIASVDVNKSKKEITITYGNGTKEVLTEKQAVDRGLINNRFDNFKDGPANPNNLTTEIRVKGEGPTPLIILDGTEISKDRMQAIDPKSIEKIDVLKDASATAIYGNKGKNGVIVITSKKQVLASDEVIEVVGKPLNKQTNGNDLSAQTDSTLFPLKEVTVQGYKKESGTNEITVIGKPLGNQHVFEKVEFEPSINSGEWKAFLEKYTVPIISDAAKRGVPAGKYTVLLRFLVEKDGSLSNIAIIEDPGHGIAQKVVEIMQYAPKWKPGIQNQKAVRAYHSQPITFIIDGGAEITKRR